ncbi:MAG: hypothetical protein RUDDFDWM_001127 [Candidatus Fervidibacterota bacterium]
MQQKLVGIGSRIFFLLMLFQAVAAQMVEHKCEKLGIAFKLPQGWEKVKVEGHQSACMFAKGKEAFLYIVAPTNLERLTAHSLLLQMLKDLEARNEGLIEVAPREIYLLDEGFMLMATLNQKVNNQTRVSVWVVSIKLGDKLIGVVCTALPTFSEAVKLDMLVALHSIKLVDKPEPVFRVPSSHGDLAVSLSKNSLEEPLVSKPARTPQFVASNLQRAQHKMSFERPLPQDSITPLMIKPEKQTARKATDVAELAEVGSDGLCLIPWLGMYLWLPKGWKVMPTVGVGGVVNGFSVIGTAVEGLPKDFVPILSVGFVPTVFGLKVPKERLEAVKHIAQAIVAPTGWKQKNDWQQLNLQDGVGVAALFDISQERKDAHAFVSCIIFPDRHYAVFLVGSCQCDGHSKLHEIYKRITTSIHFGAQKAPQR